METKEYRYVDKSDWGAGPWQDEPDKVQWTDEATGLPCLIVRGPGGALCGYVGVAEGHRYFNVGYSGCSLDPKCSKADGDCYDHAPNVDVHGGLTFSDFCAEDREHGICHVPGPGEPERVWWLGFDCAHAWDVTPGSDARSRSMKIPYQTSDEPDRWYRGIAYVRGQVAKLAVQLAA